MSAQPDLCPKFPPVAMRTEPAAHYLGTTPRVIRKLVSRGELPVVRLSLKSFLFKRSDLDRFLDSRRVAAVGEAV